MRRYLIVTKNSLFTIIPYKDHLIKFYNPIRARAIYKNKVVDLLTQKESKQDWPVWFDEYSFTIDTVFIKPRITHLFYELGFVLEQENQITDATLLAIDIEYQNFTRLESQEINSKIELTLLRTIDFENYLKLFREGREELLKGNCYQFNLTCEHLYHWKNNYTSLDFIQSLWHDLHKRGAFGSATYIPCMNYLYLSNSPECLFQLDKDILSTMPIKGTLPLVHIKDLKKTWLKLISDKKNESELFMIIDLLRNDLSRIELPRARVLNKKLPLIVPGLLHQYAKIEIELSKTVTMKKILEKIFPGGSVTGAPKKSAIRLLFKLEKRERRFYCGSTLIFFKNMKSASINIRSAEIDFKKKELIYQSGGGITLQSTPLEEFHEMNAKRESFIRAL